MSINKGLGRGLDALFNGAAKSAEDVAPQKLPINEIMPNPAQPRRYFIDQSLQELADSILAQGILQPILVRPMDDGKYQIIAGERRWRAANLAGLNEVPVIVRSMNDTEAMAAALIENLQREDLNPIEEARALASLRETLDISQDELASRLGKSRPAIANAIRLLQLSQQAQDDVANGKLSPGHARCLLGIADQNMADALRIKILDTSMTVREAEKAAASFRDDGRFPWEKTEPQNTGIEKKNSNNERAPNERMNKLEQLLANKIGCAVRINGTENRGKISLSFKNTSQLCAILDSMGIAFEELNL